MTKGGPTNGPTNAATNAATTTGGRLKALARAELTLIGRSKGVLFTAVFVPLVMPFATRSSMHDVDLKRTGLTLGATVLASAIGFSLLFAVYSTMVSVYAARREDLVLKRLRTGELRDAEILAGTALPAVCMGLAQAVGLAAVCAVVLHAGAPAAPHLVVLGVLLGLPLCVVLAALTTVFSRSVESAQVAAMPLLLVTMFGSGAVVPLEVMPDKLANLCALLPLTPTLTLVREGWTGGMAAGDAVKDVMTAVAWFVVAVFAVRRRFRWEPRR
ncbi:ABC transporter permease [Streptomyces beihaiensis]|uniref:Transport permease protein n=1 Tax=Streptomyces beihaiensis TaxID=2984495 RepID=A0ABT3TZL2_9ACTN|nr:ABC transporter permease [Streptomyces beihaiensis]MCX3062481.1 ABC transporter permease [Streptomyces beihaiensis]